MHHPILRLVSVLTLAGLAACADAGEGDGPDLGRVADTLAEDTTLAEGAVRAPETEASEADEAEGDGPGPGAVLPGDDTPWAIEEDEETRSDDPAADDTLAAWSTTSVQREPPRLDSAVRVTEVRRARHDGFDRWVVEVEGDDAPGYEASYVDEPLRECGSGRAIHPVGDGWLELRLNRTHGHTGSGEPTVPRDAATPELGQVVHLYRTCDFEGVVTMVFAVESPEAFRVFHLPDPARVVLDVRH